MVAKQAKVSERYQESLGRSIQEKFVSMIVEKDEGIEGGNVLES